MKPHFFQMYCISLVIPLTTIKPAPLHRVHHLSSPPEISSVHCSTLHISQMPPGVLPAFWMASGPPHTQLFSHPPKPAGWAFPPGVADPPSLCSSPTRHMGSLSQTYPKTCQAYIAAFSLPIPAYLVFPVPELTVLMVVFIGLVSSSFLPLSLFYFTASARTRFGQNFPEGLKGTEKVDWEKQVHLIQNFHGQTPLLLGK